MRHALAAAALVGASFSLQITAAGATPPTPCPTPAAASGSRVTCPAAPVDANQAVRVMLNEMTRLQREPVNREDISAVIAQFLTTYYIGQETNAAQAGNLAEYELTGGGWRNSLQFLEKLRAVTPADVQRVAQKYMKNIRFVVLGNPAQIDKSVFIGQAANGNHE